MTHYAMPDALSVLKHQKAELWDAMFGFLAKTDLNALAIGNHDIVKGRCWVTISEYVPRLAENVKVESHRRFIDLQYTLQGNELMGLAKNPENYY